MKKKEIIISKLSQITSLLICVFLISIIAINRDNSFFGFSLGEEINEGCDITQTEDYIIINSSNIVTNIKGFGGATPLEIHINSDNVIEKIIPLKNSESPRFFKNLEKKGLYSQWIGLTPENAINKKVNTISGATMSSNAVIKTFNASIGYALDNQIIETNDYNEYFSIKNIITILILLGGAIIPIYIKNRRYRYLQLIVNIVVLGLWSKTFLSLTMIVNFVSNGIDNIDILLPLILIIVAFVLPIFGKKQHYCTWICPYGASQEIIHSISPFKIKISDKLNKLLINFQKILWSVIMAILCIGLYYEIMEYEAFSIFIFNQADIPLMIIGFLFLILSLFIKRPYCRYVCPTGYLIKFSENNSYVCKQKKLEINEKN